MQMAGFTFGIVTIAFAQAIVIGAFHSPITAIFQPKLQMAPILEQRPIRIPSL